MLPLNTFDENKSVAEAFRSRGIPDEQIYFAFREDLTCDGNFGEEWLAIDQEANHLYRYSVSSQVFDVFDLKDLERPYIDNYTTSNRLLAYVKDENGNDQTIVLGACTNACKRKLTAFLNLWDRVTKDLKIENDDHIFDQFNAKCPKCGTVYPDQQRRICEVCAKKKGMLVRLLSYFGDFKWHFIVVLLCLIMTSAISLASPIISGQILYDQVITAPGVTSDGSAVGTMHEVKYVFVFVGLLFGLALLQLLIGIIQGRCNAHMSTRVTKRMRDDIFTALSKLSLSYFNKNSTGRLINRVNYDAIKIRSFYIDGVPALIIHSLNFIGLTIFLFSINWQLTLIVFVPIPIIVILFRRMLPKFWRSFSKLWRRSSSMNGMLADTLNGARVVKAFSKEAEETNRFHKYATGLYGANMNVNKIAIMIFPVVSLLIGLSAQAIWGFGGIKVIGKEMTWGQMTTYLGYLGMIFGPLGFFSTFTNLITDTINSASRMFETLDQIPEITDSPDAVAFDSFQGDIEFSHVSFHYNPSNPILKDISFKIHPGDNVGVVGHTGSGKSTIANLITRMYDTVSGTVYIDGTDIKNIKQQSLRRNIAIVSQEIYLFAGTIADNIRYSKPEASMKEIIEAARAANAHDFIMQLPEGYETQVGSGSRSLSGGERQRISIARALLLQPSILILDEATAAMDNETERLISEAIDKLVVGKTTITVAHRLSTLHNCNVIMAVENGEVVEMGSPEELMEKKGDYYKLYTLQNDQLQQVMAGN
ncbi:MAG: ATP-binding cassette domain-containing protein [Clostridia bacterium]|nr:ATP-binding cassette domain-containing protein [Clostridia bacterium]